jgi:2-oxoglutarate dehydrogenase E2 component (dihydrolipoamide succinyltransferase)
MVPVIKDADQKSLPEIEMAIRDFALKARDGKIGVDDLTGGTFSITNGGVFGSLMSTPILNAPQSAILGMHKVEDRPVVVDKKIEIRPMMYVAMSYDHRIVDGKGAVTFLTKVKERIESPEILLLGV